ncbi:MAG TPA: GIY-YIG nuclease family protein [Ignavibacteriaceae bacterium]|nr:GIY-YIG nuclease family protein [Ignavibacteriaceae bacterium]
MFYTYILRSLNDKTNYYGSTEDLEERIIIHNSGKVKYTKGHIPYKLHYFETFSTRREAIDRERFFKSIDGFKWLKSEGVI